MNQHSTSDVDIQIKEFDLLDILDVLWLYKKLIVYISAISLFVFTIYAYSLNDIYSSKALLAPSKQASSVDNSLRSYGGLASLAGINLPSSSSDDIEALEILSSFKFFEDNVLPKIYLPNLMAVDSWDLRTNTIKYDNSLYDSNNETWVRNVSFPRQSKPSAQESFKEFMEDRFSISKDIETGFITLSIHHESPHIAQKWLIDITKAINLTLRKEEKDRVSISINFLNEKIASTNNPSIVDSFSTLLQKEMEKLMLIESNEDFVFKIIDPPYASETKSRPSRLLICLAGLIFGILLGILYSLFRNSKSNS